MVGEIMKKFGIPVLLGVLISQMPVSGQSDVRSVKVGENRIVLNKDTVFHSTSEPVVETGDLIASAKQPMNIRIRRQQAQICLKSSSQILVSANESCSKVRALSTAQAQGVVVNFAGRSFDVRDGMEIVMADDINELENAVTSDGIYRRSMKIYKLHAGKCALVAETHPTTLASSH